jgi:hypothetical protein
MSIVSRYIVLLRVSGRANSNLKSYSDWWRPHCTTHIRWETVSKVTRRTRSMLSAIRTCNLVTGPARLAVTPGRIVAQVRRGIGVTGSIRCRTATTDVTGLDEEFNIRRVGVCLIGEDMGIETRLGLDRHVPGRE